jgi:exopolysaccharide production protein ExoZ
MFNNIQMLRAVAATMVLLYHAASHYQALGGTELLFKLFSSIGYSGVDIFFVISGFVGAHTTLHKARTWSNAWTFATRRLLRIYLGYWPFFATTLAITYAFLPRELAEKDLLGSFFLTAIDLKRLVIFVTWSLTFELLFYVLLFASFALSSRLVKMLVHVLSLAVLLILVWTYATHHTPVLIFIAMLLEFLAGMMVYIYRERLKSWVWIAPCVVVAAAALAIGVGLNASVGSLRIFTFGTAAVALVVLAVVLEQSRTFVANRLLVALGDSSYTLYLAHLLLLMIFYYLGIRDFLAHQPVFVRESGFLLFLGTCLWITHWFYIWVEGPVYRWANAACSPGASVSAWRAPDAK